MPTDKRARQRAGKQARMAELRKAQQRRRTYRRYGILGVVVVLFIVLAFVLNSGSAKKKPKASSAPSTTVSGPTTTVAPLPLATLEASLTARTPPAASPACNAPAAVPSAPTTTVPASGNAVSIIPAPSHVPFPNLSGSSPRYTKFSAPPPFCIDVNRTYTATLNTDLGAITIQLLPKYAPQTVNNFLFLAGYHFYDGVVFQRVIPGFMDQGGDPTGSGSSGPGYTIPDEYPKASAAYDNGAVAMANTGQPNSGGSQFFVCANNGCGSLPPSYTLFGQVIAGNDVALRINADGSSQGVPPKVTHKIISVTLSES